MSKRYSRNQKLIDRWDIYNNLPDGAKAKLAKKCNCSFIQVKNVLEGNRTDNQGIIKEAEKMAAIYVWKERFCKLDKSQI